MTSHENAYLGVNAQRTLPLADFRLFSGTAMRTKMTPSYNNYI